MVEWLREPRTLNPHDKTDDLASSGASGIGKMIRSTLLLLSLVVLLPSLLAQDALDQALADLRRSSSDAQAIDEAVAAVLALKPDRAAVLRQLRAGVFPAADESLREGWTVRRARDAGGEEHPYQLFLSSSTLDPSAPLPLLLHLHGSVAREDYSLTPGDTGYGRRLWESAAEERGFVLVCPLGKKGREWWRPAGGIVVDAVLRDCARLLPIDDDRIVATGFSDGASGCFHFAMSAPERFAAFLPMNGHPEVPARASGRELFPRNLLSRPLMALMTLDDALYPASAVLPHFAPALAVGAPLRLISWESGNHRPAYFEALRPMILDYVMAARRDREPARWRWRSAQAERCGPFLLRELGGTSAPAAQVMSAPGPLRMGIEAAAANPGVASGMTISKVIEGGLAAALGLEPGDQLLTVEDVAIENRFSFFSAFAGKSPGDRIAATLRRAGEAKRVSARVPEHRPQPVYPRGSMVAEFDLRFEKDGVHLDTRGVSRFDWLWDRPGSPPARVVLNGETRELAWKERPLREILRDYVRRGDRAALKTHRVVLPF
jgi:PDZ domain